MHLRAENALFIDDNALNRQEVLHFNPGISTLDAVDCDGILRDENLQGKEDRNCTRLQSYRLLEKKAEKEKGFATNEEFLQKSNIRIELLNFSEEMLERMYELCMRTNQLNFTKNRMTKDELHKLAAASDVETRLVHVIDAFGDYGIVGFYCLQGRKLVHFVFSCRIMNMGVEQFVYELLEYPELSVVGEVASTVGRKENRIEYIQLVNKTRACDMQEESIHRILTEESQIHIFALGACDLFHPIGYFSMPNQHFVYECNVFVGNERGVNVGTEYIRSQMDMTSAEKDYCRKNFHNYTRFNVFDSQIFTRAWDYVILSFHDDMIYKIYRNKTNPNLRIVYYPEPSFADADGYPDSERQSWFAENFEEGRYITQDRFLDNLLWIDKQLPKETRILLITGPELNFYRTNHPHCDEAREQILRCNWVIRLLGRVRPERFSVVDINEVIRSRDDVTDYVFHLKAATAYHLFQKLAIAMIGCSRGKKNMLWKVVNGRNIIVLSTDYLKAQNACYNLLLGNCGNVQMVHFNKQTSTIDDFQKAIWNRFRDKADKFYIVVAEQENYGRLRELLISSGFQPVFDFIQLTPVPYQKVWRD